MTERLNDQEQEYRKTSTIRASQWWQMGDHPAVVLKSAPNRYADEGVPWCPTLEGGHVVTPGDWIATGVHGEHWPIKPDVFAKTYELALPLAHPTPVGDQAGHLRKVERGIQSVEDSWCEGGPRIDVLTVFYEIARANAAALDALAQPTSIRIVEGEDQGSDLSDVSVQDAVNASHLGMKLTPVQAASAYAYELGWRDRHNQDAHPQSVGSEASTRIAELEAAWQPIETVRKDGTRLIFVNADPEFPRSWSGVWNEKQSRFEDGWGISSSMNDEIAWTHWMPLPKPTLSGEG